MTSSSLSLLSVYVFLIISSKECAGERSTQKLRMSTKRAKDGHESWCGRVRARVAGGGCRTTLTDRGRWREGGAGGGTLTENRRMVQMWRW